MQHGKHTSKTHIITEDAASSFHPEFVHELYAFNLVITQPLCNWARDYAVGSQENIFFWRRGWGIETWSFGEIIRFEV